MQSNISVSFHWRSEIEESAPAILSAAKDSVTLCRVAVMSSLDLLLLIGMMLVRRATGHWVRDIQTLIILVQDCTLIIIHEMCQVNVLVLYMSSRCALLTFL